jgi:hypothetical protein
MNDTQYDAEDNAEVAAAAMPDFNVRHLSQTQLAGLGVSQVAYVKPVTVNGKPAFAIHAADGTPMALAENQDVAMAAIVQHEMAAALVH